MKYLLFLCLLVCTLPSFSQRNKERPTTSYNQSYGYVNGVRLDSIQGEYAEVQLTMGMMMVSGISGATVRKYTFNNGTPWKNESEIRVTDKEGIVLQFQSLAESLNFFSFNGWAMVIVGEGYILLKKKQI